MLDLPANPMKFVELPIRGCFEIQPQILEDERGAFVKTFHHDTFGRRGLRTDFKESFYSRSVLDVLRGMHLQAPPHAYAKLVYCLEGEVLDALLDLRSSSPTLGQHVLRRLSARKANAIYLPEGVAHGFLTMSATATTVYKTTAVHAPQADTGVLWSSCGIDWPCPSPILSRRDQSLPALSLSESLWS